MEAMDPLIPKNLKKLKSLKEKKSQGRR